GWKVKDFKGMTFEEVEEKFNSVCKQMEDFIPMGSKEEAKKIKRKGINLEQESAKKQKSLEEITEEAKSPKEVTEKEDKRNDAIGPYRRSLCGSTSSQISHYCLGDLLKHLDRVDLNHLWLLVKETLSKRPVTSDKEMELWLYEKCGVHQLTSKDKDIFMLVEKDYPLRKGLALVMIFYKLQAENYSQMADDLALPLPAIKFLLPEELPTASEDGSHCQKKRDATARKIALLSMSRRNCQSKMAVTLMASLFFWQWEPSSLAVGSSSGSGNFIAGSGNTFAIFLPVASLFFWQWQPSSLAMGTSTASGNSIPDSGNAMCILFPTLNVSM
nr:hypothetical protein [Tanacetum cinerariifolium]